MKRVLKIVIILILGLVIFLLIKHEPLPEGSAPLDADKLATKMLNALNYEKYKDTRFLEWSFQNGTNNYKWDKENGIVEVKWDEYTVKLDLVTHASSTAEKTGTKLSNEEKEKITSKALKLFNNDSFWLIAPYKVFDEGTTRSLVTLDDGSKGLLITYSKGGTTPGDSYLWILNENGFPISYKMWVKIIPLGGLEATWDDWQVMESGAFLPKSHQLGPFTLGMGDVRAYN
ncbi:hypothetical protein LV716_15985 [Flagellimonas sp. HMM57]|uniref:hypothetical protein n=1 Tax=unclassified Flagellimonas TaxID=2644544 RepID=UPI0013D8516D|nr:MULTISPECIES: hypothetical protein [unclassified Flagellimonas]UII75741.1 hypothetical protein LV716_15985 [Flagellimonas sp. HMM57]